MTKNEIIHGLKDINNFLVHSLRTCGYTRDYDEALKKAIVQVADLGDRIAGPKCELNEDIEARR